MYRKIVVNVRKVHEVRIRKIVYGPASLVYGPACLVYGPAWKQYYTAVAQQTLKEQLSWCG